MSSKLIIFLLTTLLFLGRIPKTEGDLYTAYNTDGDDENDSNKGLQHTIHSLRGHYKEEASRLLKCGNTDEKENNVHSTTERAEKEASAPATEKANITDNSTTTENFNILPESSSDSETVEALTNLESKTLKQLSNENTIETTAITENIASLLLPVSEKQEEVNVTSLNNITTPKINGEDIDLRSLYEILEDLQDTWLTSRRVDDKEEAISNINSETSSHSALGVTQGSVLDRTQKNFEFESLVIKNAADAGNTDKTKKISEQDEDDDDDNDNDGFNNTRRFMPSNNVGQMPINYYNPFASPPPRSLAAPINPYISKVQGNNSNNLNQSNPISNNQIEESLAVNDRTSNSSEYKDFNKTEEIDDSDTDLLFSDPYISAEDLNRLASPTKGFGISEMDKSNFMLIEHPRVCFACSSTNNPSCWLPDMRTPAKYCRRGHNACVTKSYRHRGYAFIVRDCGNSCSNKGLGEVGLHYQSCTICHSDLCNGAPFTSFSIKTIILLLISIVFKNK